jgi:glycosyltransferase involved in cell wall biosynthesis
VAPGFDEQLMMAVARRAARKLGFERPCVWTYAPQYADFVGALNERCVIYDVVDDYSAMPYYQRTLGARVHELDQRLTERADLVFVVNDFLFDQRRAWNASVRHVGNAGDVKGFMRARATGEIPNDLRALGSPVIGFHGTLTGEKIDVRLVEDLIRQRPEWAFVFIGPIKDPAIAHHLRQHANVSLLGPRNATVLPEYVAGFDVLLIPYRRTAYTGRPLKVYEGLAAGVPIVATGLPELDREPGVVVAEQSAAAVTAAVERVLRSPRAPVRPEEVQGYSWEAKAARQLACVRDVLAAKAEG